MYLDRRTISNSYVIHVVHLLLSVQLSVKDFSCHTLDL